jgi:hypothetical protein
MYSVRNFIGCFLIKRLDSILVNLTPNMDPVALVKETTATVVKEAKHVKINEQALKKVASEIANEIWSNNEKKPQNNDGFLEGLSVIWDNEKVHFFDQHNPDISAQYILVLSALNFCFWPGATFDKKKQDIEYNFLAGCLKDVIVKDKNAFDSENLEKCTTQTLKSWFKGYELPQASERARLIREIGVGLQYYGGKAGKFVIIVFLCSQQI